MRSHRIFGTALSIVRYLLAATNVFLAVLFAGPSFADDGARPVKVMIINMFGGTPFPFSEASAFTGNLRLTQSTRVRGLSPDYPDVLCNSDDVCQMVTGEGYANAAASTMALVLSDKFDLRHTYFVVAGIAGIDPHQGTTGSAAWARYLNDYGISWEIDAREIPGSVADPATPAWPYGYLAIDPTDLTAQPWNSLPKTPTAYHSEIYELNGALLQKILLLTSSVDLRGNDNAVAQAYRAHYAEAKAKAPPSVIQCDTMSGDTWFHGLKLGERASAWTALWTDGKGTYCTSQQEDNATYMALTRGASSGLVDLDRVAVLRTASNFDRPYPGETAWHSLCGCGPEGNSGGFEPAIRNLWAAAAPFIKDVVARWDEWKDGVPK
ncbi:MAG: purine nucleoside permease [Alphaproteobacteria bacterium]|nr:purine nucleoside permease [Alphaproteobacteria bacterium]